MRSLEFFVDFFFPKALWPWVLPEVCTGGTSWRVNAADNIDTSICRLSSSSVNLKLLELRAYPGLYKGLLYFYPRGFGLKKVRINFQLYRNFWSNWVPSQSSSCGIYDGQNDAVKKLSTNTLCLPISYHFTNAPYSQSSVVLVTHSIVKQNI
jgi:hypothetical protein